MARASATGARHLLVLVGKGQSGRSDVASDVKRHVAEALAAKHLGHGHILSTDEGDFATHCWKNRQLFKNLLAG